MGTTLNSLNEMLEITPSERQLEWQKLEFTSFLHFGMNTFTGNEWGLGTENSAIFNPTELDTDQWCESLQLAKIKACIITAKHHDGFCLWDTKQTSHNVMNSTYGHDIVEQLSKSCKKYGIKMGIYLSPWDRHDKRYGYGEPYNDYFCNQLTELLSNYGDIYTVWFDGACGEGDNGKKQAYDWERYYEIIRRLQPNAVISVCGPDVRWCGNEAGVCRTSEWSVVPSYLCDNEKVHDESQKADDTEFREAKLASTDDDLGSRDIVSNADSLIWYPAEVDTSIRPGWFYHSEEDEKVRSLEKLISIYENSIGGNSVLLLNIPPDKNGLISKYDIARLKELGEYIEKAYARNLISLDEHIQLLASDTEDGTTIENVRTDDETYWKANDAVEQCEINIALASDEPVERVVLMEQIKLSQRIESFTLSIKAGNDWKEVYSGTTVGYKKICRLNSPVISREWKLSITASRSCPTLKFIGLYNKI